MSENNYFKVNESTKKLSEIAVENIKKEFPELPSKTEEEIRLIVSLADIYDTRLVVGTCIICSNAEIVKSKSFTNRKLDWNLPPAALKYNASRLIATGDLSDSSVKQSLEKEMLETATYVKNGEKTWAKNLAERRLDIVRIAAGEEEAYEKHEFSAQWWNQNGRDLLIESGIPADIVNKYPIQEAKEY